MSRLRDEGMHVRRQMLGDAHVNRAEARKTGVRCAVFRISSPNPPGACCGRARISRRSERSLVTIALLAGLGNEEELKLHLRATRNTGATREDVREALMHVAVYAGVPRANHAIRLAKEIFAEMDAQESS